MRKYSTEKVIKKIESYSYKHQKETITFEELCTILKAKTNKDKSDLSSLIGDLYNHDVIYYDYSNKTLHISNYKLLLEKRVIKSLNYAVASNVLASLSVILAIISVALTLLTLN